MYYNLGSARGAVQHEFIVFERSQDAVTAQLQRAGNGAYSA